MQSHVVFRSRPLSLSLFTYVNMLQIKFVLPLGFVYSRLCVICFFFYFVNQRMRIENP